LNTYNWLKNFKIPCIALCSNFSALYGRHFWTLTPLSAMRNDQNTPIIENALIPCMTLFMCC
jgi:hypothetical protein